MKKEQISKKTKDYFKERLKLPSKQFIGLILSICILIIPLLSNKISAGHDYRFHATNNIVTYGSIDILKLKLTLPQIYNAKIAYGFGYGTGIFYPPLTNYLASYVAYFLNLSYKNCVLSLNYISIFIIFTVGIIIYKFSKTLSKDKYVAGISALTYISYSYFLCNIYARNAFGESLISIFLPLVFYGLYELFLGQEKKFLPLFTIGYIGMIYSHLVLSILITIIIIIMFLFNYKKVFKKNKLKKLTIASLLILLISSPYLVPLIEHKLCGNYVVFKENAMYEVEALKEHALTIYDYLLVKYKTNNGIEVYFGYITIISSIATIILNKKIFKNDEKKIYKNIILFIIISMLLSSKILPWKHMPFFIKMIQFPWRICGITSLGVALLSGYFIKIIAQKHKKTVAIFMSILIVFFGFATIPKENMQDIFHPEKMSMGNQDEYLPVNTKENIDYFDNRNQEIINKKGETEINIIENSTPYLNAKIILNTEKATIELPRIYYLGYKITLKEENGKKNKIKYYENENGFIELEINKSGILEVNYKGTIANQIANFLSAITIIICLLIIIYDKWNKRKKD